FHIFQLHVIQLLNRRSHFWRGRIAQYQHNGLAVRPLDLVALEDFGQIGGAEAAYIVGLVHHYGDLPGGTRTCEAECKRYDSQDPSEHVSAQITIASPCAASYRSNTCFLLRGLRCLPRPAAEIRFACRLCPSWVSPRLRAFVVGVVFRRRAMGSPGIPGLGFWGRVLAIFTSW